MKVKFRGIWSPLPTPFRRDGEIDLKRLRELVDYLIEGGVDGLFPVGTSGEFAFLNREERKRVVGAVVDRANGRVPVVAGVSDPDLENVLDFSRDAQDVGADAIVATPPYYYSLPQDAIYRHFGTIHASTGLPLMVYNIPEFTRNFVGLEVVMRLADEKRIVGMKYTEYNLLNLLLFIRAVGKKVSIFTGSDAMAETCLEYGGSGAIIGISNVVPSRASAIYDLISRNDIAAARKVQLELLPIVQAVGLGYFPAGLKEAMRVAGFPVGDVKHPHMSLSVSERSRIRQLLSQAGIRSR